MYNNAYSNYRKQEFEGASKGKVVVLLYEGIIKFLRRACIAIDEKNIQETNNNIIRAERIIYELMATLNMDVGEISENLMRLYDFMIWELIQANRHKDKAKVEAVIGLVQPLCNAWKEIVEKEHMSIVKPSAMMPDTSERKSINFAG